MKHVKRQKFVIGNWKMHTNAAEAGKLAKAIAVGVGREDRVCVAVCPPFPYLALVTENLKGSKVSLGAQNLYPEEEGAFTGEVSPTMLLDLGCRFVILGHSERRHILGESDAFINRKVHVALAAGLDVILCVGETLEQREANQTSAVLESQIILGLAALSASLLPRLSIAYEPVWAIGNSGHQATPQQAEEEHIVIRESLARMFGKEAQSVVIQYGGSVKPENASALLSQPNVDGALIGGASLHADQFLAIIQVAIEQTQREEKST
jgi:triosephosphate isomerase